ncbi:hypothetical protein A3Q33_05445 [Colwellia sp. PAMC 21821]|nr:hypothetical protein A3Q33_05445 [Colwellia sp. PAMC 21821]
MLNTKVGQKTLQERNLMKGTFPLIQKSLFLVMEMSFLIMLSLVTVAYILIKVNLVTEKFHLKT